jgi:hypothetical protein
MLDLTQPLDITNWRQKGAELNTRITNEIKGMSESKIITTLPSKLQMTQQQYDDLMALGKLPNMYHQEDRMYVTPYNVMEVRVTNRTKMTFKEAFGQDDAQFAKWEKENKEQLDKEERDLLQ